MTARDSQPSRTDGLDKLETPHDPDLEILEAVDLEAAAPEPRDKPDRRRSVVDTRVGANGDTGLERRRGPGRRRSDFMKAAEEGEMSQEQFLFIKAVDAYKRVNDRPFPSWTEVLEIIRKLGYRKTCGMQLDIQGVDDWTEAADAIAFPDRACPEHESADDVDDDFETEIDDDFFAEAA